MSESELTERLHALQFSLPEGGVQSAREVEIQAVLQELEIYQIELEMQNRELKHAQEVLEDSQDKYLSLYDFAPMGYMTLTDSGLMREINLTAAAMLGVERHWLVGRSMAPWVLGVDLPLFRNHFKVCASSDEKNVTTIRLVRRDRDKTVFPVEISSTRFTDPRVKERLCRTTLTDLTERVKMETTLREAVTQLRSEKELRSRFVSMLSHDLRTPLTAAKMNAELLDRKSGDGPAVQKIAVRIIKSIDRVDRMIQDLLDAERVQAGGTISDALSDFDLVSLATETIEELSFVHGNRFVLQAKPPVQGVWNRDGLRRVVENLAGNAVKYGAADKPITVTVDVDSMNRAILSVQNYGSVISKEEQLTLFQQFRRTPSAEKGLQRGWGLGLTLVKGTVEALGGEVSVESSAEKGTVFRVILPQKPKSQMLM